jgi:hypothetical protein
VERTTLDFLWQPSPPWICSSAGEASRKQWIPSYFYSREGLDVCVRRFRGWKMRTQQHVMDEVAAALQFFDGFGENWNAMNECLCYLDEWLPAQAYVLVVEEAQEVLADDDEALLALLMTFDAAGRFWSQPVVEGPEHFRRGPAPFHLLLNAEEAGRQRIERVAASGAIPLLALGDRA